MKFTIGWLKEHLDTQRPRFKPPQLSAGWDATHGRIRLFKLMLENYGTYASHGPTAQHTAGRLDAVSASTAPRQRSGRSIYAPLPIGLPGYYGVPMRPSMRRYGAIGIKATFGSGSADELADALGGPQKAKNIRFSNMPRITTQLATFSPL